MFSVAPKTDATPASTDSAHTQLWRVNRAFLVTLVLGLAAAIACARDWAHAPVVGLWALASLAVGAFGGLLFGIPRIKQAAEPGSATPTNTSASVHRQVNNNLIEISDWLTKILVGIGLVELGSMPELLRTLSGPLQTCLGAGCGPAVANGTIVFFAVAGFLGGYINSRTLLALILKDFEDKYLAAQVEQMIEQVKVLEGNVPLPGKKMAGTDPLDPDDEPSTTAAFAGSAADTLPETQQPPAADVDPGDPNKGKFGGMPEANGRRLAAVITPAFGPNSAGCRVRLTVTSTDPEKPLTGRVTFDLHPSFSPRVRSVAVRGGAARLTIISWGRITVGAVADEGKTRLELDLSTLPGGTVLFYQS